MKKNILLIVASVLVVLLLAGIFLRRQGEVGTITLGGDKIEKVDRIRLRNKDGFRLDLCKKNKDWTARSSAGDFIPDASKIADFLQVLNLWELEEIVSEPELEPESEWCIVIRQSGKKIFRKKIFLKDGELYLRAAHKEVYKMMCAWQRSTWKDYFSPSSAIWQNRLLIDLDYFEIDSVRVDDRVIPSAPENDEYFSAFKQVYFDRPAGSIQLGSPLHTLTVREKSGCQHQFQVYTKLTAPGKSDIFKAYVVKGLQLGDTVELSYVVLDKMLKTDF